MWNNLRILPFDRALLCKCQNLHHKKWRNARKYREGVEISCRQFLSSYIFTVHTLNQDDTAVPQPFLKHWPSPCCHAQRRQCRLAGCSHLPARVTDCPTPPVSILSSSGVTGSLICVLDAPASWVTKQAPSAGGHSGSSLQFQVWNPVLPTCPRVVLGCHLGILQERLPSQAPACLGMIPCSPVSRSISVKP